MISIFLTIYFLFTLEYYFFRWLWKFQSLFDYDSLPIVPDYGFSSFTTVAHLGFVLPFFFGSLKLLNSFFYFQRLFSKFPFTFLA